MRALLILLFSLVSFSANADLFLCPNTRGYIQTGDTMDKVRLACGAPAMQTEQDVAKPVMQDVEQWIYQLPDKVNVGQLNMTISFQGGKVTSISVQGNNFQSSSICQNGSVQVGYSMPQVQDACGSPTWTNRGTQLQSQLPVKTIIWKYDFGRFITPVTLEFIDGKLTKITRGTQ